MVPSANYDLAYCQKQLLPEHAAPCGMRVPAAPATCVRIGTARRRALAGNSLIEFTLVMPILLLVATGMVAFGFALHNGLVLTNAVNSGAQLLAFSRGQTSDPCATAYTQITNSAPSLTASKLSLSFIINGTSYSGVTTCTAGAANMVQGATAIVNATYPYSLPIFSMNFANGKLAASVSEYIQ